MSESKKHVLHKCNEDRCSICDGGLAFCEVCKGGEASLPSECPGIQMTEEQSRAVQYGQFDFVDGKWKRLN